MSTHKPFGIERNREKRLSNKQTKARNQEKIYEWLKDHPEKTIIEISKGVGISRERVSLRLKDLVKEGKVQAHTRLWSTASFIERKRIAEIESKKAYRRIMQKIEERDLEGVFRDFTQTRTREFLGMEFSDVNRRIFDEVQRARLEKHGDKELARNEAGFFPQIFAKSVNVRVFSPLQTSEIKGRTVIGRGMFGLKKEKGLDYKVREFAVDLMYNLFKTIDFQGSPSAWNDEIIVEISLSLTEIYRQLLSLKNQFDDYRNTGWEIKGKFCSANSPEVRKKFPPIFSDFS